MYHQAKTHSGDTNNISSLPGDRNSISSSLSGVNSISTLQSTRNSISSLSSRNYMTMNINSDTGYDDSVKQSKKSYRATTGQSKDYKDYRTALMKLKLQEGVQDPRFQQKCNVCDKEPSVYWCPDCKKSMCRGCHNQHWKSEDTHGHIVQHVQDMYSLDYNFKVNVQRFFICDIKVLHDGVLVIADTNSNHLVTCDITGQQQHIIPLPGGPHCIAVVDNNIVAVALRTIVVLVDVRKRQVVQSINVNNFCSGIMYRDNQLFVTGYYETIVVMNMSGEVTNTILVGVIPYYINGGESGRIYYTDLSKLYCIDTVGNTLFKFTDRSMGKLRGITIDDEGHLLVICEESNKVFRISPDGKHSQVMITKIPSTAGYPNICYSSLTKSVVIGHQDNVYIYKKVYK